jgi:hypothetical protein
VSCCWWIQAATAADYAIDQFRFLERLLLVHGRRCYRRISLTVTISGLCSFSIAKRLTFIQRQKSKYTKVLSHGSSDSFPLFQSVLRFHPHRHPRYGQSEVCLLGQKPVVWICSCRVWTTFQIECFVLGSQ